MGSINAVPQTFTARATTDLSASQYVFVKYSSGSSDADKIVEVAGSGVPCGILIKGEIAARQMEIISLNGQPAKIVASAAIAVDAMGTLTTGGKGVATTTAGARVYFIATEAATADGDIISGYTTNIMRGA